MAGKTKKAKLDPNRAVAQNRKARHDYEIISMYEAGIALVGSEVKALREGKAQMRDSYARVVDDEVWLFNVHIPPYSHAQDWSGHEPERKRKLLLHRKEIDEMGERTEREGLALVPLKIFFKEGKAKVDLALARGRKTYDKRHAIAERDANRDAARELAHRQRD